MKTSSTFSVLYWLKQSSAKNGLAPLYARITVNGKRAELSLKRKLSIADWDSKKNRLKGIGEEAKMVNCYIKQVDSKLFAIYRKLTADNNMVSSSLIKSHFLGENENRYMLSDIIGYHNEHMK